MIFFLEFIDFFFPVFKSTQYKVYYKANLYLKTKQLIKGVLKRIVLILG